MENKDLLKKLVPILEKLIDSLYENEEVERIEIVDEALAELDDFLDENNLEEDRKIIHNFALEYFDQEAKNHQEVDLSPLKQMICEEIKR